MMRIAHIADVHIQDRRREEYRVVFARLYESLRAEAPGIIVVAGDVFDNKMRASPHNLEDVAEFLTALSAIAPVVMIAGNHDTNCLTPGSLDLLTPLVAEHRALQPPRLTYWRRSGVYVAHGIVWTVIATDGDRPSEAAERKVYTGAAAGLRKAPPHICLFHEEVNGALMPNGTQMRDFKLTTTSFGQYDLALGGHIHLRQRFAPRAAYCGSLIQQNIGESHHGHGYVLWELDLSAEHAPHHTAQPRMRGVDVPNDHGFVRVEVDAAGRDVTPRPLPGAPLYWELIHDEDAPAARVAALAAEYETAYGMAPRTTRERPRRGAAAEAAAPPPTSEEGRERAALVDAQASSRTLAAHEEIIRELLPGADESVEAVVALHRARWSPPAAHAAGGKFRIVRLEFDNLYAFGPANVVDFTALEGCVSGVIAPNHTGKSSLIEALLFALYEEHPRAPSKRDVIHRGAGSCRLALDFELDGKAGRILKGMFGGGKQNSSASQYRFEYGGEDRTRGGTVETLAEIETVLGGAINALASSFQLQGGEAGGFIGTTPAGRKKLIASVMGLGSFEALERATAKELTEAGGEVKALAAQYRGEPELSLEESLAQEEGNLDEIRADSKQLARAAGESRAAAARASQALGVAIGEDRGLRAAAAAAAAAAAGSAHDEEFAAEMLEKSIARMGEITPEEAATPATAATETAAVSLAQLAAAKLAVASAAKTAADLESQALEARMELARTERPVEELLHAKAAAAAAARMLAETAMPFSLASHCAAPPTAPRLDRPAAAYCPEANAAGVSRQTIAPRPTANALSAATLTLTTIGELTPGDCAAAGRWNAAEHERLKQAATARTQRGPDQAAAPRPARERPRGVPHPGLGERRLGKEPDPAEVENARTKYAANRDYDDAIASRWDPDENARLEAAAASLAARPGAPAVTTLDVAKQRRSDAVDRLAAARVSLAELGAWAAAIAAECPAATGPDSGISVDEAAAELHAAQEWAAAAAHAALLGSRLRPAAGCPGCDHARTLLDGKVAAAESTQAVASATAAHRNALAGAHRQRAVALVEAQRDHDRIAAELAAVESEARRAGAAAAASGRLAGLATAYTHHTRRAAAAEAQAVLEADNFWAARAAEDWRLYDADQARMAAAAARDELETQEAAAAASALAEMEVARSQYERAMARSSAVAVLEASNYWAARTYEEWGKYDSDNSVWSAAAAAAERHHAAAASAAANHAEHTARELTAAKNAAERANGARRAHAALASQLADANQILAAARANLQDVTTLRAAGAGALAWWRAAAGRAAEARRLDRAAVDASAAADQSTAVVEAARRAATSAELEQLAAQGRWAAAQQAEQSAVREIARLQQELTREMERAAQYREASSRHAALKAYRAVLRPVGGIGDRLLERGRAALDRQLNGALRELGARFVVKLGEDYDVSIQSLVDSQALLPASLGSGYQKFVLSLAARLAIWRLSVSPRPDAFIVDEGFGACDEEYLEAMATALEALATAPGGPRLVFLVSHVDALKVRLERSLEIETHSTGSRVVNAATVRRFGAETPGPVQAHQDTAAEPGVAVAMLGPDPEKAGHVYCEVCRQSLRDAWAARHLASSKHISMVKKEGARRHK
jgi:DNA repair exonuclease SbcCD ATPase subunit/UDP-2,3-diacylglucosamine pyrophosphatase LpxH